MSAIMDGLYQSSMKAQMAELEHEKAEIVARMETVEPVLPDFNPNIAEIHRRKVACLTVGLVDLETNMEAAMAIQSLIGEVVLNPRDKRGEVHATLRGELMAILDFAAGRNIPGTLPSRIITGVGGSPRNQHCSHSQSSSHLKPNLLLFQGLEARPHRGAERRRAERNRVQAGLPRARLRHRQVIASADPSPSSGSTPRAIAA